MTFIARWQTAQDEVTVITTSTVVDELLLAAAPVQKIDAPADVRIFVTAGAACVELSSDTVLHQRVARAAALQHGERTMAAACGIASSSAR